MEKSPVNTWFSICHTFQEDQLWWSLTGNIAKAELEQEVTAVFTSPCREKYKLKEATAAKSHLQGAPTCILDLWASKSSLV